MVLLAGFLVGCSPIPDRPQDVPSLVQALQQVAHRLSAGPTASDARVPTWIEVQADHERDRPRHELAPLPWKRREYEPVVTLGNLEWIRVPQYGAIANWNR